MGRGARQRGPLDGEASRPQAKSRGLVLVDVLCEADGRGVGEPRRQQTPRLSGGDQAPEPLVTLLVEGAGIHGHLSTVVEPQGRPVPGDVHARHAEGGVLATQMHELSVHADDRLERLGRLEVTAEVRDDARMLERVSLEPESALRVHAERESPSKAVEEAGIHALGDAVAHGPTIAPLSRSALPPGALFVVSATP